MQVGAGDVLRGQQQEEQEGQVGRRVTDKLDERLLDEASQSALRGQQVDLKRSEEETDGEGKGGRMEQIGGRGREMRTGHEDTEMMRVRT